MNYPSLAREAVSQITQAEQEAKVRQLASDLAAVAEKVIADRKVGKTVTQLRVCDDLDRLTVIQGVLEKCGLNFGPIYQTNGYAIPGHAQPPLLSFSVTGDLST